MMESFKWLIRAKNEWLNGQLIGGKSIYQSIKQFLSVYLYIQRSKKTTCWDDSFGFVNILCVFD